MTTSSFHFTSYGLVSEVQQKELSPWMPFILTDMNCLSQIKYWFHL